MNAAIGQGIGDGLQNATNTLLQIQMMKYKMNQEKEKDKITNKYKSAQTDFLEMQMANQERLAHEQITQGQQQSAYQQGQQAAGMMATDESGETGANPAAFFSSGGAPQTQVMTSANGKLYEKAIPAPKMSPAQQMEIQQQRLDLQKQRLSDDEKKQQAMIDAQKQQLAEKEKATNTRDELSRKRLADQEKQFNDRMDIQKKRLADQEKVIKAGDPIQKQQEQNKTIVNDVMTSQPGSVDYETAKDVAYGRLSMAEFNHFMGGMGQQSRVKGQAMLQLAKKINPNFNEAMMSNRQAGLKAGITSLDRQATLAGQMAERVNKFGDIALQYSGKVSRTNYPILNNWNYLWNSNIKQDPKVSGNIKGLVDSVKIFATDWARSTTGQTGGAAVTDAAREHFKDMISATDNPEVFKQLIDLGKQDTATTVQGYKDERDKTFQQYQMETGSGDVSGGGQGSGQTNQKDPLGIL